MRCTWCPGDKCSLADVLESTDENAKRRRTASPSSDGKNPWWVSKVPRRWWKALCIWTHRHARVPGSFSSTDLPGGAGRIQPQQVLTVGPLVERELKGLQAAARQGAFSPSLCQEHRGTSTHQRAQQHAWKARRTKVGSLSGELAGVPQGTGSELPESWYVPGLPFVSLLSSQTKKDRRWSAWVHASLSTERKIHGKLPGKNSVLKKQLPRSRQSSVRHRLQAIKQQQMNPHASSHYCLTLIW